MVKLSGKLSFIKESAVARSRSSGVHESRLDRKHDPEPLEAAMHPPGEFN